MGVEPLEEPGEREASHSAMTALCSSLWSTAWECCPLREISWQSNSTSTSAAGGRPFSSEVLQKPSGSCLASPNSTSRDTPAADACPCLSSRCEKVGSSEKAPAPAAMAAGGGEKRGGGGERSWWRWSLLLGSEEL